MYTGQKYKDRVYNQFLSEQDREYIRLHCLKMTDKKLSDRLKVNVNIITSFRMDKLKIRKAHPTIRTAKMNHGIEEDRKLAQDELNALVSYNYHGTMKESVKQRVLFLLAKLNGR